MTVRFQTMEEPRATLTTENNQAPMNDASMTIEFLRARLLSERAASKSARQQVRELTEKLAALNTCLEKEVEDRRKAESALDRLVHVLKIKGVTLEEEVHDCQDFESRSSTDSTMNVSEKTNENDYESCRQNEYHKNVDRSAGDQQKPDSHHSENNMVNMTGSDDLSKCENREPSSDAEGCLQNDVEVEVCQKETPCDTSPVKEPSDTISNSIASQLKSKLNHIAKEVESLPKDGIPKVDIQTWLENVGKLLDDADKNAHSSQEEAQSNKNSINTQKTKDICVANVSPISSSSDGKDRESKTTLHGAASLSGNMSSAYPSTVYPSFNRSFSTNGSSAFSSQVMYASVPLCTSEVLPYPGTVDPLLYDKGAMHSKGSVMPNGVHNGAFHCDMSGQPWCQNRVSFIRPSYNNGPGPEIPNEIYMKQEVNMTRGHGYQRSHPYYPRYNVMDRGSNNTPNSLADEKNGRLANILMALHEARQQVSKDQQLAGASFAGVESHAPVIQFPPSPSSEYVCPPMERHDTLRRSKSASSNRANYMMPNLQMHSKPREVDLGNGITLYTDSES